MNAIDTTSPRGDDALIHAAMFYRDRRQLRATVQEFVRDGVASGEPVLAVLPRANLELLDDSLTAPGSDVHRVDMNDAGRNPSCLLGMLEEWLADHAGRGGRARVISEPMWPGRSYAESTECLRHEALVNLVLADAPVSVLCPYDAEHLDADVLTGAEMTHPQLIDDAGPRGSIIYGDPIELASGANWPQAEPAGPVSEHAFDGDLYALRHALAGDPLVADLDHRRRDDLVLAVNEAATNAVRHGDGACRTRVWRDGDRVVTEVHTATRIADPLAGRRRPGTDAVGGRGLWLINQVCDLVELRSGAEGTSLRLHVQGA